MDHLRELRLYIHSNQILLYPDHNRILSQLTAIETLHIDYALRDMDVTLNDFVNLVPLRFQRMHTLNVTVESYDPDYVLHMQRYLDEMRPKVQYGIHFNDCQLAKYVGRHRDRYLAEFENGNEPVPEAN